MSTAFVLAGGGSIGAVQVGMLRELLAHGIKPDLVVGSSVGAINGAYLAGAPSLEGVRRLEAIWRGLRRRDVFPDHLAQHGGVRCAHAAPSWIPAACGRSSKRICRTESWKHARCRFTSWRPTSSAARW
jgi:predicted acylesterase/phospholipase RssA